MRTTIDIPDETYRELKVKAAREGKPLREIVLHALEQELSSPQTQPKRKKLALPIIKSTQPGTLHLTNEQIYEIIDFP